MKSKYKIGVGINYWDDPKGLLEILETPTFYENVDVIYVIDGKYANREDDEEHTKDIGLAICKAYPKIHYVKMYGVKQIDKRNKYWELAEKDNVDFMIVLDSDETCSFGKNFKYTLDNCKAFDSQCFPVAQEHVGIVSMKRPRLFKKPFNFRHRQNTGPNISHGSLWSDYGKGNEEIIQQMYRWFEYSKTKESDRNPVSGIYMTHDKKWRTKKRVDSDYQFYADNPTR